jgi:vacuolar-type H+-ATPase subunit F/Vma7
MTNQKIVVVGDENTVFGLGLIGLEGHAVTSIDAARKAIAKAVADPATAIILLTENWSEARPDAFAESVPWIVDIPAEQPAVSLIPLETQLRKTLEFGLEL